MKKKSIVVLLCVFCLSAILFSGQAELELTLKQCIDIAIQENPLVLSSLQHYQASLARINQAKAIPQPYVYYMADQQPKIFNFKDLKESYLGLGQSIEFPGKRNIRGKIATRESEEIAQDIELLKLDIIFQVKQVFYGLLLSEEKLKYARQDLELSQDFLEKAEIKFSAGDVAKVEVLRAKVEAAKAANEVRAAANEVRLAKASMNFLLARNKYTPITIKGELKRSTIRLDVEELLQRALSFRPEIKRINFSEEIEIFKRKKGYLSYFPDFDLSISKHNIEGEPKTWSTILTFPIPLFFWQPKKGEIAEAQANLSSLKREAEHLKNTITLEVEEVHMNAVTAQNQIRLFEDEIITQAEEVYNMFLFSYQEGEIGSLELIEARRTLNEARKSYADSLYNYDLALAALEKSIGQTFEGGQQ